MADRGRPSVIRLVLYLVLCGAVTGALSGWAFASGRADWALALNTPSWLPPAGVITAGWIAKTFLICIALWIADRFGKPFWREAALAAILAMLAVSVVWVMAFLGLHNPLAGFWAALASWAVAAFGVWVTGKASRGAAALLWPVLAWASVSLVIAFEVMRLNAPGL